MIRASPTNSRNDSPPLPHEMNIRQKLKNTYGEYYEGSNLPKRDKIKVQIAAKFSPRIKDTLNSKFTESSVKGTLIGSKHPKVRDNHYVEAQVNGVPMSNITHNMTIAPS